VKRFSRTVFLSSATIFPRSVHTRWTLIVTVIIDGQQFLRTPAKTWHIYGLQALENVEILRTRNIRRHKISRQCRLEMFSILDAT